MGDLTAQDTDSRSRRGAPYVSASAAKAKEATVDTPSSAYLCMHEKWEKIETLLAGTDALRAAAEHRLPRHQYESHANYTERLGRSTLDNYVLRTLEQLVGKAFKEPPVLGDDVPQALVDLAEDIDGEGTGLQTFVRGWFQCGVAKAFAHVLVDFSRPAQVVGRPRTLADDAAQGVRPFWRLIDPEDVISMQGTRDGATFRLTQVRIRECSIEPDGRFGERFVTKVRVLEPGSWELHVNRGTSKRPKWEIEDSGPMGLSYIPLVTFYSAKAGLAEGKPPLDDLADLNIEHYQSASDQRSILTVARFPILACSGAVAEDANTGNTLVIGPRQWLSVADPTGKFYFVEHTGKAIESGYKDLERLEAKMASYGAQFLRKQPGQATATGKAIDSAESISQLKSWGLDFKDAIEVALGITAEWLTLGRDAGGSVEFEIDGDLDMAEPSQLDALTKARASRDISREAFLSELKRRDVLDEDFDPDKDKELLDKEVPAGGLGLMFPGGGPKPAPPAPKPPVVPPKPAIKTV